MDREIPTMEKHITLLGILYIALSASCLLAACIVFTAVVGGGILSGDDTAMFYTWRVGTSVTLLLLVLSIPGFIGAYGLLKRRMWGRYLVLVLGAMNLVNLPFGTALGIYTFWVLLQNEAAKLFE